jgi:hypothetical protein
MKHRENDRQDGRVSNIKSPGEKLSSAHSMDRLNAFSTYFLIWGCEPKAKELASAFVGVM